MLLPVVGSHVKSPWFVGVVQAQGQEDGLEMRSEGDNEGEDLSCDEFGVSTSLSSPSAPT